MAKPKLATNVRKLVLVTCDVKVPHDTDLNRVI